MYKELLNKQDSYTLRGICMLLIILHHIYFKWITHDGFDHWIGFVFLGPIGQLSTGLFFFLSGYGLYYSMNRNKPLKFVYLYSRIKRMLLAYTFAFFIFILVVLLFDKEILSKKMLFDYFTLTMPFTVSWFFKVIIGVYVISYLCFRFLGKAKVYCVIGMTCLYIYVARKYLPSYWYDSILNFPMGMLFAVFYHKVNKFSDRLMFITVLFCSLVCALFFRKDLFLITSSLLFTILSIYIMKYLNIKSAILTYIGINSLCFYLFQSVFLKPCELIYFNAYWYTMLIFVFTSILVVVYVKFVEVKIR